MDAGFIVVFAVIWVLCGVGSAFIAKSKGRDPAAYFLLGFFLGIIGLIIAAAMPKEDASIPSGRAQIQATWLNNFQPQPTLERGRLAVTGDGVTFTSKGGAPWVIPIQEIVGTQVFTKTTAPSSLPLQADLFRGTKSVVIISRQSQGQVAQYIFSGPSSAMKSFAAQRLEPTRSQAVATVAMRPCPFCAEPIRAEAVKCRYCGSDLPQAQPAQT